MKRFTLIELLITIVIIAILASLLLPSLRKAKRKAKKIVCLNNTKQINLALLTFTVSNDGKYPQDTASHEGNWPWDMTKNLINDLELP